MEPARPGPPSQVPEFGLTLHFAHVGPALFERDLLPECGGAISGLAGPTFFPPGFAQCGKAFGGFPQPWCHVLTSALPAPERFCLSWRWTGREATYI